MLIFRGIFYQNPWHTTYRKNNNLEQMRGHGSQWFSHKMNNRHPLQLKKWKSWEPFGSYQLNTTANPAHLPQNWPNLAKSAECLAGSFQTALRILIFSIAMGADYSFYVKTIETHARAFFKIIIFSIDSVSTYHTHMIQYILCTVSCVSAESLPSS